MTRFAWAVVLLAVVIPGTHAEDRGVFLVESGAARGSKDFVNVPWFGPETLNISSRALVAEPANLCEPATRRCDARRRIMLVQPNDGCSIETKARHARDAGCALVVLHEGLAPVVGSSCAGPWQFDGSDTGDLASMVTVYLLKADFDELADTLRPTDPIIRVRVTKATLTSNPWYKLWHDPWFHIVLSGVLPIIQLAVIAVIARQLYRFSKRRRPRRTQSCLRNLQTRYNVAEAVLTIDLIAGVLRVIFVTVDPLFSRHIYPRLVSQLLISVFIPITAFLTVLIALAWRASLNASKKSHQISKAVVPLIVFFVVLLSLELSLGVLRGLFFSGISLFIITSLVYVSIFLTTSSVFIVYGTMVVSKLRQRGDTVASPSVQSLPKIDADAKEADTASTASQSRFKRISSAMSLRSARSSLFGGRGEPMSRTVRATLRMSRFVRASAIGILALVGCIAMGATKYLQTPLGLFIIFIVTTSSQSYIALCRALAFEPPPPRSAGRSDRSMSVETSSVSTGRNSAAV